MLPLTGSLDRVFFVFPNRRLNSLVGMSVLPFARNLERFYRLVAVVRASGVDDNLSAAYIGSLQLGLIDARQFHQVSLKPAFQGCFSMNRDGDTGRDSDLDVDVVASSDTLQLPTP